MNHLVYYTPLVIYIISSIILVKLYYDSSTKYEKYSKDEIPSISMTGMTVLNKDISVNVYLVSFIGISMCALLLYMKCINIPKKPSLNKLIIGVGIIACVLNIVQGIYTLDTNEKIHEITANGGIFLHLVALSLYLKYTNNHNKSVTYIIIMSWLSIMLSGILNVTYVYKSKKYKAPFSLVSSFQRLCILFLILAGVMIAKDKNCLNF